MDYAAKFAALAAHAKTMAQTITENWETEVRTSVSATASFRRGTKRAKGGDYHADVKYGTCKLKDIMLDVAHVRVDHHGLMVPPDCSCCVPYLTAGNASETVDKLVEMHKACLDIVKPESADAISAKYHAAMEDIVVFLSGIVRHIDAPVNVAEEDVLKVLDDAKALLRDEPDASIDIKIRNEDTPLHTEWTVATTKTVSAPFLGDAFLRIYVTPDGDDVMFAKEPENVYDSVLFTTPSGQNCFLGRKRSTTEFHVYDTSGEVIRTITTCNLVGPRIWRCVSASPQLIIIGGQNEAAYRLWWFSNGDISRVYEHSIPGDYTPHISIYAGPAILLRKTTSDTEYVLVKFAPE